MVWRPRKRDWSNWWRLYSEHDVEELVGQGEEVPSSSIQKPKSKKGGNDNGKGGAGSQMRDQFDCIV